MIGKMNNHEAIKLFNRTILGELMRAEGAKPNPKPDWPARQQAWNDFIDSLAKSGDIPESVGYDLDWVKPSTISKLVMGLPWFENRDDAARYYVSQFQNLWEAEAEGRINIGRAPVQLGEYYRTKDLDGLTVVHLDPAVYQGVLSDDPSFICPVREAR